MKNKIIKQMKKRIAWNKGLTKEDPRVKAYVDKKIGKPRLDMIGHKWNVGRKQLKSTRDKRSISVAKFWEENRNTERVLLRNKKISEKMLGKKKNYKIWNDMGGKNRNIKRPTINGKPRAHVIWCRANQIHRVPDGCVIHHINLNPLDDRPENLQLLEDKYHRSLHNQICKIMKRGGIATAV